MQPSVTDLFDKLTSKLKGWLTDFVVMLPNLVIALLIVAAFGLASKWVARGAHRGLHRVSGNEPVSEVLASVARVATVAVGLFIALGLLQLDRTVTSLLAGVGVIGLALGFAFQDIAANFMSGILMAIRRPFDVGDMIEIEERLAKVAHVGLRATTVETLDGLSVMVPNKNIFQNPIINYTKTPHRRMDLTIGTAYCDDLEKVRAVTLEAVKNLPDRLASRELELFFDTFGESSIDFTLRVWLARADEITYRRARSEAMIAIKKAYDAHGVTIPFPIRTLDFGAEVVGGERLDAMALRRAQSDPQAAE